MLKVLLCQESRVKLYERDSKRNNKKVLLTEEDHRCIINVYTLIIVQEVILLITIIKKWGNSLAIRIPKSFADEVNIEEDTKVDISVEGNRIIIEPILNPEKYELEDLLSKVKESNIHSEYFVDEPEGKEVW